MKTINRETLRSKLKSNGLKLVEVLAKDQYEDFHLPGAINVPIGVGFEKRIQEALPGKDQEVVVYCWDEDCDASPKAAKKMEEIGFTNVWDYESGKADWKSAGLPIES